VRGESREQRFASWVAPHEVIETVAPCELAHRRSRRTDVTALNALDPVETIMNAHGLEGMWGPAGSVGFELASGTTVVNARSDLDLVIGIARPETLPGVSLVAALGALPVRVDALLETLHGAVALHEYVRSQSENGSFMLRTVDGPRLTRTLGHPLGLADHDPGRSPHPSIR
jgi:phosphoribosyl-dephospho-CoA transferase